MKKYYILVFSTILTMTAFSQVPQAYYPFTTDAGDSSINHYFHATASGTTSSTDRFGAANRAFQFDGTSSYVEITSHANQLNYTTFSYAAWVKIDELPANGTGTCIVSMGEQNGDQSLMLNNIATAKGFGLTTWNTDFTSAKVYQEVLPVVGRWYHVIIARDASTISLYLDGNLIRTADVSGKTATYGATPANYKGYIGKKVGITPSVFKGAIDDVKIYNLAVSPAQAANLFAFEFKRMIVQYNFSGNTKDTSGHGNDATNHGASLTTDRFGAPNNAYQFNGTDNYMEMSFPELALNRYTWSAWVKLNANPVNGKIYSVLSIGDGTNNQDLVVSNLLGIYIGLGLESVCTDTTYKLNKDTLPVLNKWYSIIITRDATNLKFHIDGKLIKNATVTNEFPLYGTSPCSGSIGMKVGSSQFFNGAIDDIKVLSYDLTGPAVVTLYNAEKVPTVIGGINEDNAIGDKLKIFPNPANRSIHIRTEGVIAPLKVNLYNLQGKLIHESENMSTELLIENLDAGIYFCEFAMEGRVVKVLKAVVTE